MLQQLLSYKPAITKCIVNLVRPDVSWADQYSTVTTAESQNLAITTDRLLLKPLSMADEETCVEIYTDPQAMRYHWGAHPEEDVRDAMPIVTHRAWDGMAGIWTINDRKTRKNYGVAFILPLPIEDDDTDWEVMIRDAGDEHEFEIGCILKPSACGLGYGAESMHSLIDFAFNNTDFERLVAVVNEKNEALRLSLEKCGLQDLGEQPAYGKVLPWLGLAREDWKASVSQV